MIHVLEILLAVALALLNAFFVAAEFGMVKLRHTRVEAIKDTHGFRGKILAEIHKHLDSYLSACQLGITLASLALGWIGEPAFAGVLKPLLKSFGIFSIEITRILSVLIAFSFLSFLHIVVGELMPKSLAIRQAERISLWTAVPLYVFYWVMFPAIWLLNTTALFLLKLSNLDTVHRGELTYSPEEIKLIFSASHLHGDLTKEEVEILEHTLDFADLDVSDIMRPIDEMVMLESDASLDEQLKIISETRYSRYPFSDSDSQDIIGMLHVKDLIPLLHQKQSVLSLKAYIRPAFKVRHYSPALEVLRKFREGMPHFAIVYGTMQTPIGFITLDNLLQVIVGRIKDEFHKTKEDWIPMPDGGFLMAGNCSIYALEKALGIVIPVEEEATTLNGLIYNSIHAVPKKGDRIEFDSFYVIIDQMKGPRILKAKLYKKPSS